MVVRRAPAVLLAALACAPTLALADGVAASQRERRPELVRVRGGLGGFGSFVVSVAGGLTTMGRGFAWPTTTGPFVTHVDASCPWRAALASLGDARSIGSGFVLPRTWVLWRDEGASLGLSPTTGALFPPPTSIGVRRGVGAGLALTLTSL